MEKEKIEEFLNSAKEKASNAFKASMEKTKEVVEWSIENPEKAIGVISLGSIVIGSCAKGCKKVSRFIKEKNQSKYMYCGTVNRSVRLRHALSDREIKQLASLMQSGLTRYEALEVMGVIK